MNKSANKIELSIGSALEYLDLVQTITDSITGFMGFDEDTAHWIGMSVRESVTNAIQLGNKLDQSKKVEIRFEVASDYLEIFVKDQGNGFRVDDLPSPLDPENLFIEGENPWRFEAPKEAASMMDNEHKALFQAVRNGTPVNNGPAMCHSSMLSVLGEMVCCTVQQMTWEQVMKSELSFALPQYGWDVEPPIKPGADGHYPAILPGITKLG